MGRGGSWGRVLAAITSAVVWAGGALGQEAQLVVPGDGTLDMSRLEAFDAVYEQVGIRMDVRLSRSEGTSGSPEGTQVTWDLVMQMPTPAGGTGIDHIGHRGDDFSFAYRRFGFGAFRNEYLEADAGEDALHLRRMFRDEEATPAPTEVRTSSPVVDGTAVFWALGLLPLETGRRFRFPTWDPTPDGLQVRESAVFEVGGQRSYELDGQTLMGHVIVASTGGGQFEMLVVPHPPYLLEQSVVGPDGSRNTVVSARTAVLPQAPGDEASIREAGAAFSRAYMSGDTATVRSLYTHDAELFPPDRTIRGRDAIARYFAPVDGRVIVGHRMATESLDIRGDVAVEVGTWHQTSRRDGASENAEARGGYLIEWRKGLDGEWRIRRDMWHRGGD